MLFYFPSSSRREVGCDKVKPVGGTVPLFVVAPTKGGQPAVEVSPIVGCTAEVAPNAPSSIFAKRKQDDSVGSSSHKKSRDPLSLRALR